MSGITPLIDTLLATRLAQRVDLVPLKGALEITDPQALPGIQKAVNEVRLPSRAARQQTLEQMQLDSAAGSKTSARLGTQAANSNVTLSAAVRALAAMLEPVEGPASQVLGVKPLWSASRAPVGSELTAALRHTVDTSGLFYESHLLQFAGGARTLAQLTQEPQALLQLRPGEAAPTASAVPQRSSADSQLENSKPVAVANTGIHPDAVALVRQQLDMLAAPVFRWAGEAWPGTPLRWEIEQQPDDRPQASDSEAPLPVWSSRLRVDLPKLKAVEVRLSLVGNNLQLRLAASEDSTLALLGTGYQELPQRLGALGLQLGGLHIDALTPFAAHDVAAKDNDASA